MSASSPPPGSPMPPEHAERPLRVAHVVATSGSTGVESYLLALLASFDPHEVEAVLFVPGPGPLVDALRARGVAVEFGAPTKKLAWREASALARRWTGAFDIVHAHGPRAAFWAVPAARWAGIANVVLTIHELRWQTLAPGFKRWAWNALEQRVLASARVLVAVSEATRRDLVERRPDLASRTRTIHGSAPLLLDELPALTARTESGKGPLRLVSVGRLSWQKGHDILFEALAIAAGRGLDFTLDLVGEGALEGALREQARRSGIEARVHWLGSRFSPLELLPREDVFITTARAEMFGIAVLEAMALGLPILAPELGSFPEVVGDGVAGRLVSPRPAATLAARFADVLLEWAGDPQARLGFARAARERARTRFGPQRLASEMTAMYREMMARSSLSADFG
jgi:glycosyltransferase involved in cell wall biosynthesis